MNKKWLVTIGAVLLLAVGLLASCTPGGGTFSGGTLELKGVLSGQQEGIFVNGEGKVTAVPDVAILRLGVEAQATSVAQAQKQAAEAMDNVMEALKDNGVAAKDIQTQSFNIQKVARWDDRNQQEVIIGYRVTNVVTAKIRDVARAGTVIDAVADAGGDLTRIDSIGFTVDDPTTYQGQAREKAVANAAAKAKQLAAAAGVKLGSPISISESTYIPGPIYRDVAMAKGAAAPEAVTPVSPGELEIVSNVQLVYEIN
ncbi:MAG: hypothetical protein A2Z15_06520 [Chloroflexi bacterium RBG_16_50_11]|nr:MAG: hypothetical protein A2Z15_06520 [Chloroflexi bacterium RBG_16_50_11]